MDILCLDLEGVLIPEIWQAVARETGIEALQKTTRDIPVYDELMQYRLGILDEQGIGLSTISAVIARLEPLPGAAEFLHAARARYQIAILSDTFYEFGQSFMSRLGNPLLLCHRLQIQDDRITGYTIRQKDPKRRSVQAFKSLNYTVYAAGDSYNDVTMLEEADRGVLFCAPDNVKREFPQYATAETYTELMAALNAP